MKRDERNSSGEEGDGNPRAQNRQASEEAVRKLQFETARRILFSTETVPGSNPPREWWTSAGFLRYDDLQFEEEFQLGPYTLKVTEGSRQDNLLFAAPVWLQMTGSIGSWYNSDMGMDPKDTDRDIIVAGGQWVCIGILKSDTFVSIIPNFLNLTAVQLFSVDDAGDDDRSGREFFYPEPNKRDDYLEATAEGSISGAYIATIDEDSVYQRIKDANPELDSENEEDKEKLDELVEEDTTFELFNGDVRVDWVQLQPEATYPVFVLKGQPPLHEEGRWDGQEDRGDTYKTPDGGQVKTFIDMSGEAYWVKYDGPIPFDFLVPYLEHRVPEQFLSSFLSTYASSPVSLDRAKAIFSFTGPNRYWNVEETVWHATDIAAVSFVQSYLVYILSGPDKRRFIPDSTDKSPMKETQLPPCLLKLRPRAKAPTQLALVVDADNGREVVSGSVYFRFFFETLASRAYSASLKVMGLSKLRKDSQVGIPEFVDRFSKFMAGTFDTEALTGIFAALDAVKERSERTEFLSAKIELVGNKDGSSTGQMPILGTRPTTFYPGPEDEAVDQTPLPPLFPEIDNLPSPRQEQQREDLMQVVAEEGPSDRAIFEAMALLRKNSMAITRILQGTRAEKNQVPSARPRKSLPVLPLTRREEEFAEDIMDEGPSDRLILEALSILRENSRAIARILQRKRPERPESVVPETPGKGNGPSPAKRMTPGSASGNDGGEELNVDAVIASLIGKMALSSSHLRSLEPVEAADAIGELLVSEKNALLINQFIDAAIADQAQYLHLVAPKTAAAAVGSIEQRAPSTDPSALPIACNIPSCVNTGTHRCSACKSVYYCSSDCQTRDWKNGHSNICQ
jgi:hypothetical protein